LVISCYSSNLFAKNVCEKYENRLNKIQVAQRQGHSLKRSNSLNEQERLMREKWWQCKKSPAKFKKSTKKTAKKKYHKPYKKQNKKVKTAYSTSSNQAVSPFKTSQDIVFKERFQGDKKLAWLKYYQQPLLCQRPKNLAVFASCAEDKQYQRQAFEHFYRAD
jgi:hypothetical protein